jgi:two-component system sensor histidine kinase KdpD
VRGSIYAPAKIPDALANFFTDENLTTLRELALREVASSVDRDREEIVRRESGASGASADGRSHRSSRCRADTTYTRTPAAPRQPHRRAASTPTGTACTCRPLTSAPIASTAPSNASWWSNIQIAQSLGAEFVKLESADVATALTAFAHERGITLLIVGRSGRPWWARLFSRAVIDRLVEDGRGLDILVVSVEDGADAPQGRAT